MESMLAFIVENEIYITTIIETYPLKLICTPPKKKAYADTQCTMWHFDLKQTSKKKREYKGALSINSELIKTQ